MKYAIQKQPKKSENFYVYFSSPFSFFINLYHLSNSYHVSGMTGIWLETVRI